MRADCLSNCYVAGDVVAVIGPIVDSRDQPDGKFAVELGFIVNQERQRHDFLILLHVNGERSVSDRRDSAGNRTLSMAPVQRSGSQGWELSGADQTATVKHVKNRVAKVRIVRTRMFVPS